MGRSNKILGKAPVRAFGSWVLASYVAGVLISMGFGAYMLLAEPANAEAGLVAITMSPLYGLFVGVFVIALTALPMLVLTSLVRRLGLRRPRADLCAGALMGAGLVQMFGLPIIWGANGTPPWLAGRALTASFAAAGAISGWVYWRVAGRPGRIEDPAGEALNAHVFD